LGIGLVDKKGSEKVDEKNNLTFKQSKIMHGTITIIMITFLFSALPEWSITFFMVNAGVGILAICIMLISWKRTKLEKRYFSLSSYCLLFALSFMSVQPILRVAWGEGNNSWIYLGLIWLITFIVTTLMKENIFRAFSNKLESRFSIAFHIVVVVFILLTPIVIVLANFDDLYNQDTQFYLFGAVLYVCSMLFLIMLPAFLKHPKDILKEEKM
jgi:hypothetical protein